MWSYQTDKNIRYKLKKIMNFLKDFKIEVKNKFQQLNNDIDQMNSTNQQSNMMLMDIKRNIHIS